MVFEDVAEEEGWFLKMLQRKRVCLKVAEGEGWVVIKSEEWRDWFVVKKESRWIACHDAEGE